MGLKDMIAKARTNATGALTRNRQKIDQGVNKIGEVANTRTGGRHEARIRKGTEQARAGLDKSDPDRPGPHRSDPHGPDPDGPIPAAPSPR
ncbi:hypothetical protein CRM73_04505 [Kocuria sp. CCUG 69068]|uniref:antitoxin n=1 Tax=Kocuria sp. CCUG 69068 TaxID=2043138 RepID=UPI001E424C01|nr:hypothetical protein [Kocuria sp. CCUG 69068]